MTEILRQPRRFPSFFMLPAGQNAAGPGKAGGGEFKSLVGRLLAAVDPAIWVDFGEFRRAHDGAHEFRPRVAHDHAHRFRSRAGGCIFGGRIGRKKLPFALRNGEGGRGQNGGRGRGKKKES